MKSRSPAAARKEEALGLVPGSKAWVRDGDGWVAGKIVKAEGADGFRRGFILAYATRAGISFDAEMPASALSLPEPDTFAHTFPHVHGMCTWLGACAQPTVLPTSVQLTELPPLHPGF